MSKKNKFLIVVALTFMSLGISACETVDGAGKDIEKAGESIQDSSK